MKLCWSGNANGASLVAPRAGAWIETPYHTHEKPWVKVAPRAGAWIETIPD